MAAFETRRKNEPLLLPDHAPRVRVTAGAGTAAQKTRYLRRPVTLIGSQTNATIRLRRPRIEPAHCVIVNTGSEVLLKDLHSASGTYCNGQRVDLTRLQDGDLLQVAGTSIQVAIQTCRAMGSDEPADREYTRLVHPLLLQAADRPDPWTIEDNCTVLGSHDAAGLYLDHVGICPAHALVFTLNGGPALFRLASEPALSLNGLPVELTPLNTGDALELGGCLLAVTRPDRHSSTGSPPDEPPGRPSSPSGDVPDPTAEAGSVTPLAEVEEIQRELDTLRADVAASWRKINDWRETGPRSQDDCERELAEREAELELQDATLRGRLHDLTGYQEELAQKDRDLHAARRELEGQQELMERQRAELDERERAIEEREDSVLAREKQVARRERLADAAWLDRSSKAISDDGHSAAPADEHPSLQADAHHCLIGVKVGSMARLGSGGP